MRTYQNQLDTKNKFQFAHIARKIKLRLTAASLAAMFAVVLFAGQSAYALISPGTTLDPGCQPTDANCQITPSATLSAGGVNSDIKQVTGLTTALSASQGGTGQLTVSAGDILYGLSNGTWGRLADGANGQTLSTNGTGTLAWVNGLTSALGNGLIFVGDATGTAAAVALSGDATISNAGVLTISTGAITSAKILDGTIVDSDVNASANIALTKLANGANIVTSLAAPTGTNVNGGSITSNVLTLSLADSTNPGLVSTSTQTLAGDKTLTNNLAVNGNTTLGDASTDRVTINGQLLGANALVFQGATDNTFETTLAITDPTADRTITIGDASGALLLDSTGFAQNGNSFGALATLGTLDSYGLRFVTGSAEAMRVLANGNVAVGTSTTSSRFTVAVPTTGTSASAVASATLGSGDRQVNFSGIVRQRIDSSVTANLSGLANVRVTLSAPSGSSVQVDKVFIGIASNTGDPYDFASAPTAVPFGGSTGSFTIPANGTSASDFANISIPAGSDILIAYSAVTVNPNYKHATAQTGWQAYVGSSAFATAQVNDVDISGYAADSAAIGVSLVETQLNTGVPAEALSVLSTGKVGIGTTTSNGLLTLGTSVVEDILSLNSISQSPLSGWLHRQPMTVTNSNAGILSNHQVSFTLDTATLVTAGKMRSDGNDIRIVASDGTTVQSHFVQSGMNTASTTIWFKASSLASGSNTFYLYYGNSGAANVSNADNVFELYDDFDGTLSKWSNSGFSVSGGSASSLAFTDNSIVSISTFTSGVVAEFSDVQSVCFTGSDSAADAGFRVGAGSSGLAAGSYGDCTPGATSGPDTLYNNGTRTTLGTNSSQSDADITIALKNSTQADVTIGGVTTSNVSFNSSGNFNVSVGTRFDGAISNQSGLVGVGRVVVRKYAASAPTVSFAAEIVYGQLTERLSVNNNGNILFGQTNDGLIGFDMPGATYDKRLRVTAGLSDTMDNSQGASIDFHGNDHTNAGRLDLVAGGATGAITAWTNNTARLVIDENGNVGIGTDTPSTTLDVAGTAQLRANGALRFADADSSNYVSFQAPATVASNVTYTLPNADGASGQMLSTNGSGALSWTASSSAVSGLTAATAINTIDNTNYAQTWNWSTATTQNPLTMNMNALTTGTGFSVRSSTAGLTTAAAVPGGVTWTARTSPVANQFWNSVTYGNGLFVAVAETGTGNRVMTSPDGITWTSRTSAADNGWTGVTYGNGLFVAVGYAIGTQRVMTSPDGITWTLRTAPVQDWRSVTYANNLFVAVSSSGTGNRVMTSPDGITWTSRTSPADNSWRSVTYGNALFVAVAEDGTTANNIMTSPDGITWTSQTSPAVREWLSVTYGNNIFVAVAKNAVGSNEKVMTSSDGITWTPRSIPITFSTSLVSVVYGDGLFAAMGSSGSEVATSSDGITWAEQTGVALSNPTSITYGNGLFVAVALLGGTSQIATSPGPVAGVVGALAKIDLTGDNANNSGNVLSLSSSGLLSVAKALQTTVASTGNLSSGGVNFNFTGAHTGNGVQVDDATLTGNAVAINANSLTTGTGLSLVSSSNALNSTNGLLSVVNTGTSTSGTVARIQANSTTGSGLTVLANGNVGIGTATPSATLDVAGTAQLRANGALRFADADSSNYVSFQAPTTVASNVTYTLPDADGSSGQVLSTNGTGALSWATAGGGGVTASYLSAYTATQGPFGGNTGSPSASNTVNLTTQSSFGSDITLSSNTVTLVAGKTYRIDTNIGYLTNSNGTPNTQIRWYDVAAGADVVGSNTRSLDSATNADGGLSNTVVITPSATKQYKLYVNSTNTGNGLTVGDVSVHVEVIAGNAAVTGQMVDYVNAKLTASTVVTAGSAIPFTTQTGNIPNTSGVFSLTAGKTYRLEGVVGISGAGTGSNTQWRDITNNVLIGNVADPITYDINNINSMSIAEAIYTPTTNVTVRLENTNGTSNTYLGSAAVSQGGQSYVTITQLGSSAITGDSMVAVGGNTLSGTGGVLNIGTLNSNALAFLANNAEAMRISAGGNVAIGSTTPSATSKLLVSGPIASVTNPNMVTTGGTVDTTTAPGETIVTYNGSGSFTAPTGVTNVRVLVVGAGAGGGGGETNSFGGAGGGGAGGRVIDNASFAVTQGASVTVTVGSGGAAGTGAGTDASTNGGNGGQSVFSSLTAAGGGGGKGDSNTPASSGWNGGGGAGDATAAGTAVGGFAGGAGNDRAGGGGGGSSQVGENAAVDGVRQGGDGGEGVSSNITGSAVVYGSGAGGAANSNGGSVAGGTGGTNAGTGDTSAPNTTGPGSGGSAGTANRGGGGGGGTGRNGFAGGSGTVIVRFTTQTNDPSLALLRVTNTGTDTNSVLAFFETGSAQSCIIAGGSGIACSSDINLKKNVLDLGQMLDNVMALRSVTYDWKTEADGSGSHIGFIAQEVEELFPDLVSTDPNGNKVLAYDRLIPIVVKAMQEQQSQLDEQAKVTNAFSFLPTNEAVFEGSVYADKIIGLDGYNIGTSQFAKSIAGLDSSTSVLATNLADLESELNAKLAEGVESASAEAQALQSDIDGIKGQLSSLVSSAAGTGVLTTDVLATLADAKAVSISGDLVIGGKLVIKGRLVHADQDAAGTTIVPAGQEEVEVTYKTPFEATPVLHISAKRGNVDYEIVDETAKGFIILLSAPAETDTGFSWSTIATQ